MNDTVRERATVVRVDGDRAWIVAQRQSTCGSCQAKNGCGTAVLSSVLGRRQPEIEVDNFLQAKAGDQVSVDMPADWLLQGAALLYLLPLVTTLLAAVLVSFLGGSDLAQALAGGVGLSAGFWWVSRRTRSRQATQRPTVVTIHSVEPILLAHPRTH